MHSFVLANERSATLPSFATRRRIVALLLAGSVAACATVALELPSLTARGLLLPADHPVVLLNEQIAMSFGMQNPVVWVIAARAGDIWQPSLLARVQSVTREVFAIPGVIGPEVVSIASPNVRDFQSTEGLLTAVYLMSTVPTTPAGIETLRRRIESDPLYHGTLVSLDGRAAMVVADFQPEADGAVVAAAARVIRDRYGDEEADVYIAGAPVMAASLSGYEWWAAPILLFVCGTGAAVLAVSAGTSVAAAAGFSAALAVLWALAASLAFPFTILPWIAYGVLPAALMAPAFAVGGASSARRRAVVAVGLITVFIGIASTDDVPALSFGLAGAFGTMAAFVAGGLVRECRHPSSGQATPSAGIRLLALGLVLVATVGVLRSAVSLQPFGHGVRYLPATAAADLRGVERHFPPPLTLTLRVRGEPGFVTSPEVLSALDAWAGVAREDPAVVRAMSLADLVEMVHRAFNDDRRDRSSIPEDAALVSRYLTLAYGPGFRRFLDRSFSQTAVWAYLSSDRPSDVARVYAALSAGTRARPITSGEIDLVGGDAAVLVVLWETIRAMAARGIFALVLGAIVVGAWTGREVGWRFAVGGACAGPCAAGMVGWLGLPIDLVTLPAIVSAVVAGSAYAALGWSAPFAAFVAMAVASLFVTLVGGGALGTVTSILLLASLAASACVRSPDSLAGA